METIWQKIVDVDLTKKLHRVFSGVLLAKNDKLANRMGANVFQDGEAVNLSGYTVKGYFIRNGNETIVIEDGAIIGNQAYVELPGNCYFYDGSYTLTIKLCQGGQELALVIFDGQVGNTITDAVVENENVINPQDFMQMDWLNRVETAAETALEQAAIATEAATAAEEAWNGVKEGLAQVAPCILVDASGDMVHITDGAEAMPVASLITHVEPKQEGSGDPSPDNVRPISGWDAMSATRAGKNLFQLTPKSTTRGSVSITVDNNSIVLDGTSTNTSSLMEVVSEFLLKPGIYTLSYNVAAGSVEEMAEDATHLRMMADGVEYRLRENVKSVKITVNQTTTAKTWLLIGANGKVYSNFTLNVQLEKGDTATDFEPPNMQTLTATLPETLYGFDKNWTTGLVTVNKLCLVWDGTEGWQMGTNSSGLTTFRIGSNVDKRMAAIKQETNYDDYDFISSHFNRVRYYAPEKPDGSATMVDGTMGRTLLLVNSAWATVEDCTTYLAAQAAAGNPLTGVFDLAEPYTIQLTPQQLSTLKGTNNIWSDAGATDVTYVADTKMYIDGKIAAIAAAIV